MTTLARHSLILALLSVAGSAFCAADYFPPPDSEGGWRQVKNEKEARDLAGVDLSKLEPAKRSSTT